MKLFVSSIYEAWSKVPRALLLVAIVLAVLWPHLSAFAQEATSSGAPPAPSAAPESAVVPDAPPTTAIDETKEEARMHFRRGVDLFQEGAHRAALVEFERAYQVAPDFRVLYNIAQAKYQVHDYLGATQMFERYLHEGGNAVPAARRNVVEFTLSSLQDRIARLVI
jgi:tetratricopeptide (TPR) repeat protein